MVLDGVVRSWPPIEPLCLRWQFPCWTPAPSLDPSDLDTGRQRRETVVDESPAKRLSVEDLLATCLRPEPQSHAATIEAALDAGCSERRAERLLKMALERGQAYRWPGDRLATSPPPPDVAGDDQATRRDTVLALLQQEPALSQAEVARRCGVSRQYVTKVRHEAPSQGANQLPPCQPRPSNSVSTVNSVDTAG
jgi:hypothetical protein